MRRFLRKPRFWIILIVASFVTNILAAWVTIHKYLHIPSSSVLFAPPSFTQTANDEKIPDSLVWHRMLQENPGCHDQVPAINGTNHRATNDTLPPFGFRQDVHRFLKTDDDFAQTCYLPSSTYCHVTRYSVVVLSKGSNLRKLFLNLMTFVSYPSVLDITLILDLDKTTISKDVKYGQRLLEWDKQRTVKVIPRQQSLWSAIQLVQPHSASVIWIDGDVRKDWNGTTLKSHLHLWRERSRSLLASNVEASGSCPFPKLHGMVMHRYLLCYLDHPVVGPLQRYTGPLGWDITQNAISMLWNHLGDGHAVAPHRVAKQTVVDEATEKILDYFGCPCSLQTTIHSNSFNSSCSNY